MNCLKRYLNAAFKRIGWFFVSSIFYIMRVFPIKKGRIYISNYFGKGYGDSPKYICNELLKYRDEFRIVWCLNDLNCSLPSGIRKVKNNTIKNIYEMCIAEIWIDNCRKPIYVRKRKGQYYIQTWHGDMGNKKSEGEAIESLSRSYIASAKNDSKMADLFLSGNEWFSRVIRKAYWYNGEIANFGSPRRDILYNSTEEAKENIKKALGINNKVKIVLYAPTFRKKQDLESLQLYDLKWEMIIDALGERFGGEWIGICRLHPNISKMSSLLKFPDCVVDATSYQDMQELLMISDICISDYSSSIFEFAVTKKPSFVYAPDYEDYISNDRQYQFSVDELPFPFAIKTGDLIKNIKSFNNEEYLMKLDYFYNDVLHIYKEGDASKKVAELLLNRR